MTTAPVFLPLSEHLEGSGWPFGGFVVDAVDKIYLTAPELDGATGETLTGIDVPGDFSVQIPGLDFLHVGISGSLGGLVDVRVRPLPPAVTLHAELDLRIRADVLRPLKPGTDEPDPNADFLRIPLGGADVTLSTEGHVQFDVATGLTIPRSIIGTTGIIIEIGALRWLTPQTDLTSAPTIAAHVPPNFTGLYLENVSVEVTSLPISTGQLTLEYGFIGTGGFTGAIDWADTALTWNGTDFQNGLHGDLLGFNGALSKVKLGFRQNAVVECEIDGNIFVPYLDRVIGLSLGFDGSSGVTAVAKVPTCQFTRPGNAVVAGPEGYIVTADTAAFTLDISRVACHTAHDAPASIALSGRAKLKVPGLDLPAVVFKGLRIDAEGNVAVEGGWLDVDTAKSTSLSGFPFQITKIGFGAETPRRRWIALNGGLKLADGLPIGSSVEGLRVVWDLDQQDPARRVTFALEGVALELRLPGTLSFAGKVAFFSNTEATGFRGTLKLKLEALKVSVDARLMIGRTADGTSFFFFALDVDLPAGIPLFSSGAAIYGFAGLVASNLRPARAEGEDWYYGYYKRHEVGVTHPAKWSIERGAFAAGLGTTLGSLPDTGFAFSAKVLLVLVLPGPQLLLQGKGQFLAKKPRENEEGNFEALLVLDIPAKLFQANLAAAFGVPSLTEPTLIGIGGGVDVAFSWNPSAPTDIWHVYLGEKAPAERRIRATLFKILQGDSWLMINRAHTWPPGLAGRLGDFEIGGSLGIDRKFDFGIAKAWLDASLLGAAAITWDPQQFKATATLKGSAGVSALGLSIVANLLADAEVWAPNPWYLSMHVEVGIKIDLLLFKWKFDARLPLEFGDKSQPLPEPVTDLAALSADHMKADEARALANATVPPDVRPLVVFKRPVQDLARFGPPGRDDIAVEDLGLRQVSYRLRHVLLVATGSGGPRLVGAAGELAITGATASFEGLTGANDGLPALAGAQITLFRPGETLGPFVVSAGSGSSATVAGNPPTGTYAYRLGAPRPTASAQIASVGTPVAGEVEVTIAGSLANPERYRGGSLVVATASWLVLEATGSTIRIRVGSAAPTAGAATLLGPAPATIEGRWFPAGDPVAGPDSSTRLQIWAKTPYAFFRHNEQTAIAGLDAFRPGYACGPEAVEEPICTTFDDVRSGPLSGQFATAGISGTATGNVSVVATGTRSAKRLELGRPAGHGSGTVVFAFDPPVDAVWVTADTREAGTITAWRDGAVIGRRPIDRQQKALEFSGGIDRIDVAGADAAVHKLCFLPGWTCVHFEAASFPQGRTGEVSYAGVALASEGAMTVDVDTLEVDPPESRISILTPVAGWTGTIGADTGAASAAVSSSPQAMTSAPGMPTFASGPLETPPMELALTGLVEPALVTIPALGTVKIVPALTPLPGPGGIPGATVIPPLPADITVVAPWRDRSNLPVRIVGSVLGATGRVWVEGSKAMLATVTIVFPRPVTHVRVRLASRCEVIAFAGRREACRDSGGSGDVVSLYANSKAAGRVGWIDRVLITGAAQVRVREVCVDRGDLGWKRYEQWKWSQGVQRGVESLYSSDPVLPPGTYELRVHTVAVVTGAEPGEKNVETARAIFTVGEPAGFPVTGRPSVLPGMYPYGGPLTDLSTYVDRTLPAAGTRLWYRGYDTAVGFNESYVTRMYLEAGHELQVFVVNASGVAIRKASRHVWGTTDASLDAWTDLYVRTLNGDGTNPCATVAVDKVTRPEQVTAGGGEPLEPARLHASELRTVDATPRVLHRFEFTTSRYVSFRHHLATFDGRCRRLLRDAGATASTIAPRDRAATLAARLATLATAVTTARTAKTQAETGTPNTVVLDAAKTALAALLQARGETQAQGIAGFDEIWRACFGTRTLPDDLRLSVVQAITAAGGTDVLLMESPEPIAWERTTVSAVRGSTTPLRKVAITFTPDFGRPDAGFEVMYGGIRWLAGVELWVIDGAVRARADEPLSVTLYPEQASVVELTIRVDPGGSATITTVPAQPGGAVIRGPSATPITVQLTAGTGHLITSVMLSGSRVGLQSCSVTSPFVPVPPSGPLRIADVVLPTATQPLDHEIVLLAMEGTAIGGYAVRWVDAITPGPSELYASVASDDLQAGQRIRLIPSRASVAPNDDALVQAGGPGTSPPATGAIYQLLDPDGCIVHECPAMPVAAPVAGSLIAFPNQDGTRAFLVPPPTAQAIGAGYWEVTLSMSGDVGPDLDPWSIGGVPVAERVKIRFEIL